MSTRNHADRDALLIVAEQARRGRFSGARDLPGVKPYTRDALLAKTALLWRVLQEHPDYPTFTKHLSEEQQNISQRLARPENWELLFPAAPNPTVFPPVFDAHTTNTSAWSSRPVSVIREASDLLLWAFFRARVSRNADTVWWSCPPDAGDRRLDKFPDAGVNHQGIQNLWCVIHHVTWSLAAYAYWELLAQWYVVLTSSTIRDQWLRAQITLNRWKAILDTATGASLALAEFAVHTRHLFAEAKNKEETPLSAQELSLIQHVPLVFYHTDSATVLHEFQSDIRPTLVTLASSALPPLPLPLSLPSTAASQPPPPPLPEKADTDADADEKWAYASPPPLEDEVSLLDQLKKQPLERCGMALLLARVGHHTAAPWVLAVNFELQDTARYTLGVVIDFDVDVSDPQHPAYKHIQAVSLERGEYITNQAHAEMFVAALTSLQEAAGDNIPRHWQAVLVAAKIYLVHLVMNWQHTRFLPGGHQEKLTYFTPKNVSGTRNDPYWYSQQQAIQEQGSKGDVLAKEAFTRLPSSLQPYLETQSCMTHASAFYGMRHLRALLGRQAVPGQIVSGLEDLRVAALAAASNEQARPRRSQHLLSSSFQGTHTMVVQLLAHPSPHQWSLLYREPLSNRTNKNTLPLPLSLPSTAASQPPPPLPEKADADADADEKWAYASPPPLEDEDPIPVVFQPHIYGSRGVWPDELSHWHQQCARQLCAPNDDKADLPIRYLGTQPQQGVRDTGFVAMALAVMAVRYNPPAATLAAYRFDQSRLRSWFNALIKADNTLLLPPLEDSHDIRYDSMPPYEEHLPLAQYLAKGHLLPNDFEKK